jgi:hypothetical protein
MRLRAWPHRVAGGRGAAARGARARRRAGAGAALPTTDAVLLAVLAHAALRQLFGRAQASGSLPAARAQLLRDRYDALAVLRAVQAQVFSGSCDDDEAAKFFSRDDTVIEGVQLGAFDAGHTGHGEVAAALRGFLSGAGLKQEL